MSKSSSKARDTIELTHLEICGSPGGTYSTLSPLDKKGLPRPRTYLSPSHKCPLVSYKKCCKNKFFLQLRRIKYRLLCIHKHSVKLMSGERVLNG